MWAVHMKLYASWALCVDKLSLDPRKPTERLDFIREVSNHAVVRARSERCA